MSDTALVNGSGEPVELAGMETRELPPEPPEGEVGSAYSGERLFVRFDDGAVFETRDVEETDFDEMLRRDGKAKTLEQVLTLPLRSAEWEIEEVEGDRGEAEAVRDALTRPANSGGMATPMELVIAQMTSAILYRRSYFEKVFGVREGRVVYRKLAFRHPHTCTLLRDKNDYGFRGFRQRFRKGDDYVTKTIKAEKAFVYIHGQHRDPLNGTSDLETAYTLFEAKQKVRFLWYAFLENQTIPKALAQTETNDEAAAQSLAEKVATLKGGGVLGLVAGQSVDAFESNGQGAQVFRDAMDYLSNEQAGSILAGFTNLTDGKTGSYALSRDQSDFFLLSRQAVLTEMGSVLTSWVVADIAGYNFADAKVPTFKFKPLEREAAEPAFQLLKELTTGQPDHRIPTEFLDLLIEKVASHLDLDTDRVATAIRERADKAETPAGELAGGIAAAHRLVAEAGVARPQVEA